MNNIGEIIRNMGGNDNRRNGGRYVCEVCGASYDYTNTLCMPSSGYGYQIYDTCSEQYIGVCKDCIDALQAVINSRHAGRSANNGR